MQFEQENIKLHRFFENHLQIYHLGGIINFMKIKTSVSLSSEILSQLDTINSKGNRSDFIEKALWRHIELLQREKRNQNDLHIINTTSRHLNKEAEDVLLFQVNS
ncbi:MAG: hypothetical protein LBQ30_04405 [Treponema sp.]|nr:hypothetical protein [Treponema sp.]